MVAIFSYFSFLAVALSSVQVLASPIAQPKGLSRRSAGSGFSPVSLDLWGGFQSLNGFDNFFGVNNFNGGLNEQILLQLAGNQNIVCQAQNVNLIQQQLAIVSEFAKRILLEQVCEPEVQVLLLDQFLSGLNFFGQDLRRLNVGRFAGFDVDIANQILQLVDDQNNFNLGFDFGFNGFDVGKNLIVPSGILWNDVNSPANILKLDQVLQTILAGQKGLVLVK